MLVATARSWGLPAAALGARWGSRLASTLVRSLIITEHGRPETVIKLREECASPAVLGPEEVCIKILAAPVNPSDINTIEGKYPLRLKLPAVPGHEGVGVVTAVGSKVAHLRPGDRVVPLEHGQGTWRSHGVFQERHWCRIPKDLPIATAATMVVNPPTALELLEKFVELKPGDTVVQNGASSSVGKYVIQLAKSMGVSTVNVVRDLENRGELGAELRDLGADVVTTAEGLRAALRDSGLRTPVLGLDGVGGAAATAVARALDVGGTLVTYGAMSHEPVCVPSSTLIFRDLRIRGYWLTGGFARLDRGYAEKEHLVDRVCALFRQKVIRPVTVECVPLVQWQEALARHSDSYRNCKVLLTNYEEDVCL